MNMRADCQPISPGQRQCFATPYFTLQWLCVRGWDVSSPLSAAFQSMDETFHAPYGTHPISRATTLRSCRGKKNPVTKIAAILHLAAVMDISLDDRLNGLIQPLPDADQLTLKRLWITTRHDTPRYRAAGWGLRFPCSGKGGVQPRCSPLL